MVEGGIELTGGVSEVSLKDENDMPSMRSPRIKKALSSRTYAGGTDNKRWRNQHVLHEKSKSEALFQTEMTSPALNFDQSDMMRRSITQMGDSPIVQPEKPSINPCKNCMRKLSVHSPASYAFIRWMTYVLGRTVLFVEIILNVIICLEFKKAGDAFYFGALALFVVGPYILLWNAGMKMMYKIFFIDHLYVLTWLEQLWIMVYLFPLTGIPLTIMWDILYFLYMIARRTAWIFSGTSVFQNHFAYIESARGVYSFFCEGLCKSLLFAYLLTPNANINAEFEELTTYIMMGLVISGLNALRNLWRLFKESKNESMGFFRFLFFRMQLAEITMPAYLPKMGAIYRGTIKVCNYSNFPLTAESSSQLITAVQQSSRLEILRFSESTIAGLQNDAIRVFSTALNDKQIIWMTLLNSVHVDNLWREIVSERKRYITKDEWRRYCQKSKIYENVTEVFDEMADTYPDRVYKRDVLDWVLHNDSIYRFNILDIAFPLHDAIKKHAIKRFHFCCVREKCYVQDPDGLSVWMTAVKSRLKINDLSFLLIKEDEFDYLDKEGKSFIDHLFDQEEDYIIQMINHLARRINIWELTRKSFTRHISRKCIQLFFNDEFCASFEHQLFDYRELFSQESMLVYGYNGWDEFIKASPHYYWSDVEAIWVGKYFNKDIIKWYIKVHYNDGDSERRRRFRDIVEGLCNRLDNLGPYLLLECMNLDSSILVGSERPTDYVVNGVSQMHQTIFFKIKDANMETNSLSASDVKLLAATEVTRTFMESFEEHMPTTVVDLYFDDFFIDECQKKGRLDFRGLFVDHRLANFKFNSFKSFINNFETHHILAKLAPSNVGRYYDNRIISWFLSERRDTDKLIAQAIWNRSDGNNLFYLLECCSLGSIIGMLNFSIQAKALTKERLKEQFGEVFEYDLPSSAVRLFFDDRFVSFLSGTCEFDYRDFVLKYVYTKPEFMELLAECPDQEKIQSMIDAHVAATGPRWTRKRKNRFKGVQEFVETEMRFFKEMENIKLEYIFPVLDLDVLKQDELELVFPDVLLDILRFTTDFSQDLELMWVEFDEDTTLVSEVVGSYMRRVGDTFYKYHCGYPERVKVLKRFQEVKSLQPILCPADFNLHYANCQNIPITRPSRYGMLLKEILKSTPHHHRDYHGLNRMFRLTSAENMKINDRIKEWEQNNTFNTLPRGNSEHVRR